MSGHRTSLLATLALASALVAACSGGAAPTTAGGGGGGGGGRQQNGQNAGQAGGGQAGGDATADLCSVWTSDQVTAAVGGPGGSGSRQNDGQMCLWTSDAATADASISIDDGQGYAATCAASSLVKKVDGVGDGACFLEGGDIGTSLEFQKNGRSYQVAVQKPQAGLAFVENAEKTLALEALPKL